MKQKGINECELIPSSRQQGKDAIAKKFILLFLSVTYIVFCQITVVSAAEITVGDLKLSDSCIRAMLPGAQVTGGY